MALASRKVEYAQEGDVKVGRVVDTVVNSGAVAQRERTVVEVPTEGGKKAVFVWERFVKAVPMVRYYNYQH